MTHPLDLICLFYVMSITHPAAPIVLQSCCLRRITERYIADSKRNRKINSSPMTIDDKEVLKKLLVNPPIKKIDLHFPLGLEVTARNLKGVTIKDALDAIHKQFKKKV